MTQTYHGFLVWTTNGEDADLLGLMVNHKVEEPLAVTISDDLATYGSFLSVRYWLSDTPMAAQKIKESVLRALMGYSNADYGARYSELTGYLWTDEEINVGGHDLLEELSSRIGKYLHMEIDYHNAKPLESTP